ncbi:MAG: hypothetical protein PHW33_02315 [Candidatus Portnoybacteria bacterium]|nr:hypothetical protein [Candidatus Portnoybacteria bacterium]
MAHSAKVFRKGKEFPEVDIKQKAREFAEWVHKYFVSNNWTYADIDNTIPPAFGIGLTNEHIPTVDELEKQLNELYTWHKKSWTEWGMSGGRLRVQCNNGVCRFYAMERS